MLVKVLEFIDQIGPALAVLAQVLGVLVVGMICSAVLDQTILALLPRIDRMVLDRGAQTFTDRVALPFLSAVLGAVLGAFVSLYVTGDPSLWQRIGACTALGLTLGAFVSVWSRADRALPQQLFDLCQRLTDPWRWDRLRATIRTERAFIEIGQRWSRVFGLVIGVSWLLLQTLPAAFAWLLYMQHYLPTSSLRLLVLATVLAAVGQTSILLLVFLGWPRMRRQRSTRLDKFETELAQLESELADEAERQSREAAAAEERLANRLQRALKEAGAAQDRLGPARRTVKALLRL